MCSFFPIVSKILFLSCWTSKILTMMLCGEVFFLGIVIWRFVYLAYLYVQFSPIKVFGYDFSKHSFMTFVTSFEFSLILINLSLVFFASCSSCWVSFPCLLLLRFICTCRHLHAPRLLVLTLSLLTLITSAAHTFIRIFILLNFYLVTFYGL